MSGAVAPLRSISERVDDQLLQTRGRQCRAEFPFLSDHDREVVKSLDMTEESKSRGVTAIPYTFSLLPDLTVHNVYCGYWYVGRPTLDELRMDLREMMKKVRADFDPQALKA
jgi:peroxiredoxin